MNMLKVLQNSGLKANEAKIYLASLDLGEATVSELARELQLPRSTILENLSTLHKNGLVNFYLKKKRKFWVAENPQKLSLMLKERENELAEVLPQLQSMRHSAMPAPKVSLYTGPEEIKLIMNDILKSRQSIRAMVSWDTWMEFFSDGYIFDFIEKRAKAFLRIQFLTPRTKTSLELKKNDEQYLRRTKFLPEDVEITNSNFIYGSKVAIISFNKKDPMGILIEDEDVAHTMGVLFDNLWSRSHST